MFRRWISMPAASNALLQILPEKFSHELRTHNSGSEQAFRPVGVRAVLSLHDLGGASVEVFTSELENLRAHPLLTESDTASSTTDAHPFDLSDVDTDIPSADLIQMVERLRDQSSETAGLLRSAADEISAGQHAAVPDFGKTVLSWNTALESVWNALGINRVPSETSFAILDSVTNLVAEQEATRLDEQSRQREMYEEKLARLRSTADSLEALSGGDETFRSAYDHARGQIAELEQLLGQSAPADTDPPCSPAADESQENDPGNDPGHDLPTLDADASTKTSDEEADVESNLPDREVDTTQRPSVAVTTVDTDRDERPAHTEPEPETDTADQPSKLSAAKLGSAVPRTEHPAHPTPAASTDVVCPAEATTLAEADTQITVAPAPDTSVAILDDHGEDLSYHLRGGNFGAAWLIAQASALPALDIAAYRLAATAFHSAPGGIDPSEVLIRLTSLPDSYAYSTNQSAKVALAAVLRAALTAGWIPRSELETIVRQSNLDSTWRELVDVAIAACDRNYQHLHDFGSPAEMSTAEVHRKTRAVQAQLDGQRIKFARADKVLKHLLHNNGPLGEAFDAVLAPTSGEERRQVLTDVLKQLDAPDALIETADTAVNSQQARRVPIVAFSRSALRKAIETVHDCVLGALNTATAVATDTRAAAVQETHHQLVTAATALAVSSESGPGDEAMRRLVEWIIAPQSPTRVTDDIEVLVEESLPVTSTERDASGLPIITADNAADVIRELRTPKTPRELFDTYTARGDLQEAGFLAGRTPELHNRLVAERSNWRRRLSREVDALRAELGHTYADDFTQGAHAFAEAQLVTPDNYTGERFDLQMADLERLRTTLAEHRSQTASVLRGRVDDEITVPQDRNRITDLINSEDFIGANELLALARGGPLPAPDGADASTDDGFFDAFAESLSALDLSATPTIRDLVTAFSGLEDTGAATVEHGDLSRLGRWANLLSKKHGGRADRQATMGSILRALGLDTRGELDRQPTQGVRHFDRYRVLAAPVDGSLVPALGSQATHYIIVATADHKLLRDTLAKGFPTKNGPNIVLFDGVLTLDQRRQCLAVCREQKISALVIDHAVAAFVAVRSPRSFKAVQQITLPFTCFTHYTVVAGNVPDEVFVGRANELTTLTDRAGSLFVYGGRQLGKSALLRKIQRDFNAVPDHHAIFIDLNSHGIGSWADSQTLWPVLYNELAQLSGTSVKPNAAVRKPEPVIRAIEKWLDDKESRRLLLLLDEADSFLEKESHASPHGFQNIGPLKRLFDNTAGRFKPVFAGLHKVQRLQNVANTPLAHGGRDILIGPLAAKPARDLVVKPLEALGYRFANPEAVWRLLAFTNLQPGLIQVVCNDLIAHLQSRPLHKGEPMVTISDADIDKVTGDSRTRDKIAEKLRLTIALEDRYRVIALAVAIMCMEDNFRDKYTAADIRLHCEVYWQQGFEDLNSSEFAVYLDELVGLGVLINDPDDRFSVRSPNIVTMLGSKEQLETELDENKEQFELPHEYNPRSTRRQLTLDNSTVRSPLSEHDLSQLIPVKAKYEPPLNHVVTGSTALGIHDVARVLKSVGDGRAVDITMLDPENDDVASVLASFKFVGNGPSAPRVLVVDAARADAQQADAIAVAVQSMRKRGQGHLVIVYGVDGISAADRLLENRSVVQTRVVNLQKWSGDGIRSWHDNPFNTPADRRELLRQSGGWPELVERAVADVSDRGISHAEEWERLSTFPDNDTAANNFLQSVGVGDNAREILTRWAHLDSTSYERLDDVADVIDCDINELRVMTFALVRRGVIDEFHDEYMIDPVVARALTTLR